MIVTSNCLFSNLGYIFSSNGKFISESEILNWLTETFGEPGSRWTYYYLLEYFSYPDQDFSHMAAIAVDVVWEFEYEEDAILFRLTWCQ